MVLAASLVACGGGDDPRTEAAGAGNEPAGQGPAGAATVAADSLVLVANVHEAPLHFIPGDWADLFHFRFADELLMLSPESSPEVRDFMAGVIRSEARRAGTVDAGFDWLRRLDNVVLAYETEADDVRWRLRQGHAWLAILPASEVGPLLEREGFQLVPLASGLDPDRWETDSGADADAAGETPEAPADWYARWVAEVRGRG